MPAFSDITGKTYNRLTAVRPLRSDRGKWVWEFKCECGKIIEKVGAMVVNGHFKSCGCLFEDVFGVPKGNHGLSGTKTYDVFRNMKQRCYNETNMNYKYYGARGIKVCDEWLDNYPKFLEDMGECPEGYSIERIDVNGNYTKENCKWIPKSEQASNRTNIRVKPEKNPDEKRTTQVMYKGELVETKELAKIFGVSNRTIRERIRNGWSIEEAVEKPKGKTQGLELEWEGRKWTLTALANHIGMSDKTLYSRLYLQNKTLEEAITTPISKAGKRPKQ